MNTPQTTHPVAQLFEWLAQLDFAESGFGTVKTELEMTRYDSVEAARKAISQVLAYYNLERKHSSLDYVSPRQFELRQARSRENPDRPE